MTGYLLAPQVSNEMLQSKFSQQLGLGTSGSAVISDCLVPDVEHVLPVGFNGNACRRSIDRDGAIAAGRLF
jgi:hypothetical protein